MRPLAKRRRGSAAIEFAIAASLLIPVMAGTFQFGYTFYAYNILESAVANGARYGSTRTYRVLSGATDVTKVKTRIQNMVVFGSPNPPVGAVPLVKGLATSNVVVDFTLSKENVPFEVRVSIVNFSVNAVFQGFSFNGKPVVTYPYVGRYAPQESEP